MVGYYTNTFSAVNRGYCVYAHIYLLKKGDTSTWLVKVTNSSNTPQ